MATLCVSNRDGDDDDDDVEDDDDCHGNARRLQRRMVGRVRREAESCPQGGSCVGNRLFST